MPNEKDVQMSNPTSAPTAGVASGSGSGSVSKTDSPTGTTTEKGVKENHDEKVKYVRITTHGKMKTWIANSLAFFEDADTDKQVVFHTLPASIDPSTHPSSSSPPSQDARDGGGKDTSKHPLTITPHTASSCTSLIPRLLSVVEIIKREFMKRLEETKSARMRGLEQYNELGNVERLGILVRDVAAEGEGGEGAEGEDGQDQAQRQRSEQILQALSGKNFPRQSQTPYMRITLSLVERPDLVEKGATYQPPAIRKISKSGKARAKKRAKKAQATALEEAKKAVQPPGQVQAAAPAPTKSGGELA